MKIPCSKHEGQQILFIRYDKNKTDYVCDECFIGLESSTLQNLIHIKNAFNSPEYFLTKLNLSPDVKEYLTDLDKMNDKTMNNILLNLKNQITKIQQSLQDVYEELEQNLNSFLDLKQKIRDELKKITKFDNFTQIIKDLEQLGDSINPQAIEQSEKLLHEYFQDLTQKDSQELNSNLINMLKNINVQPQDLNKEQQQNQQQNREDNPQYKKFNLLNQQFNQNQIKFVNQTSLIYFDRQIILKKILPTQLLSNYYRQKIIYTIQSKLNRKVKECKVQFIGAQDGLNVYSFWNKVNGNSNLLFIFKSKSRYIFGGFSPCLWQQQSQKSKFNVQDDTLSSFLFSQTHDQIYPLKQSTKSNAISCQSQCGPAFGEDLFINGDFQDGYSRLGQSYWWDQYQNAQSTHLFGQQTPNITECEIYQVTFIWP